MANNKVIQKTLDKVYKKPVGPEVMFLVGFSAKGLKNLSSSIDPNRIYAIVVKDGRTYGGWDCTVAKEGILHPCFNNYNTPITVDDLIKVGGLPPETTGYGSFDFIKIDSYYRKLEVADIKAMIKKAPSMFDNEHINHLLNKKKPKAKVPTGTPTVAQLKKFAALRGFKLIAEEI